MNKREDKRIILKGWIKMKKRFGRIYNKESEILMKKANDCFYNAMEKLPLGV
jgi:hypothetical protein